MSSTQAFATTLNVVSNKEIRGGGKLLSKICFFDLIKRFAEYTGLFFTSKTNNFPSLTVGTRRQVACKAEHILQLRSNTPTSIWPDILHPPVTLQYAGQANSRTYSAPYIMTEITHHYQYHHISYGCFIYICIHIYLGCWCVYVVLALSGTMVWPCTACIVVSCVAV